MRPWSLAAMLVVVTIVAASCGEEDDSAGPYSGYAPSTGGSSNVVADGGLSFDCPAAGSAFVLEQAYGGTSTMALPWYPGRWCERDDDCGSGESCFEVTAERGLCASPEGVTCAEVDAAQAASSIDRGDAGGSDAGLDSGVVTETDAGTAISCNSGACFYERASGFLQLEEKDAVTAVCTSNECGSGEDCSVGEICVPGWVGPTSRNSCMATGCTSDADCAHARCGMCVFLKIVGWPVDSNPIVNYLGSGCL